MPVEHDDTQLAVLRTATLAPRASGTGDPLQAGARLDHFQIENKLGAGGMGEVYLATDLALDRPVAIKVLPAASASGAARERLVREARAQARVHHPNVAHIYFVGEDRGRLYFAMEHLAGGTLADAPLPVEDALAAIRAAALGLREAQRAGFTHRDVKPSNLMKDAHGVVKVVDFGLVAAAPEPASGEAVAQTTLAGTPLYMAPEQARGEPIDHRADIYALGATLYHLVAGKPPFAGDTLDALATLHRTAARPQLPRRGHARAERTALDALVAKMMASDPADRFASYDELLLALELASAAHTRPAGFAVRCMAAAFDFLVVAIVIVGVRLFASGTDGGDATINNMVIPGLGVLQTLAIGWRGRTPGQAGFELEVVAVATGEPPSWRAALIRSLAIYGAPTAFTLLAYALPHPWSAFAGSAAGILYVAAIALLLYAALRVPGKRAYWDRVAGTIVRYRAPR